MSLSFKLLGAFSILAVLAELAYFAVKGDNLSDQAEKRRAADIAAGRFP